jgi:hypothetical protein
MPAKENSTDANVTAVETRRKISLDTWAVIFALVAAALVRAGVIKHIPW